MIPPPIPSNREFTPSENLFAKIFHLNSCRLKFNINDANYNIALTSKKIFESIPKNTLWNRLMKKLGFRSWILLNIEEKGKNGYVKVNASSFFRNLKISPNNLDLKKPANLDFTSLIQRPSEKAKFQPVLPVKAPYSEPKSPTSTQDNAGSVAPHEPQVEKNKTFTEQGLETEYNETMESLKPTIEREYTPSSDQMAPEPEKVTLVDYTSLTPIEDKKTESQPVLPVKEPYSEPKSPTSPQDTTGSVALHEPQIEKDETSTEQSLETEFNNTSESLNPTIERTYIPPSAQTAPNPENEIASLPQVLTAQSEAREAAYLKLKNKFRENIFALKMIDFLHSLTVDKLNLIFIKDCIDVNAANNLLKNKALGTILFRKSETAKAQQKKIDHDEPTGLVISIRAQTEIDKVALDFQGGLLVNYRKILEKFIKIHDQNPSVTVNFLKYNSDAYPSLITPQQKPPEDVLDELTQKLKPISSALVKELEKLSHGIQNRKWVEAQLRNAPLGSIFVRFSNNENSYVISYNVKQNQFIHHALSHLSNTFHLVDALPIIKTICIPGIEPKFISPINYQPQLVTSKSYKADALTTPRMKLNYPTKELYAQAKAALEKMNIPSHHLLFNDKDRSFNFSSYQTYFQLGLHHLELKHFLGIDQKDRDPRIYPQDGIEITLFEVLPNELITSDEGQKLFYDSLVKKDHSLKAIEVKSFNHKQIIDHVYDTSKKRGLQVGEQHDDHKSKEFIIANIAVLYEKGVRVLFLEHMMSDVVQKDLNQFFKNPNEPMSNVLKTYLERQDKGQRIPEKYRKDYGFVALVEACVKAKIKVIAIDTEASYHGKPKGEMTNSENRMRAMNHQAYLFMKKYLDKHPDHKYISLVGNGHLVTFAKTPGLSEITGDSCIAFESGQVDTISFNQTTLIGEKLGGIVDIKVIHKNLD